MPQICRQGYSNTTYELSESDKSKKKLILDNGQDNNTNVTLAIDKDKNEDFLLTLEGTAAEVCVQYSIGKTRGLKGDLLDTISWNDCITKVYNQSSWINKYEIILKIPKMRKVRNEWVYCKSAQELAASNVNGKNFYKKGNLWNARKSMYFISLSFFFFFFIR